MTSLTLLLCSLLYLSLLFAVAYWAEQRPRLGGSLVNNPYLYALSISVYCTAWTFYGSVGRAASDGIEFLAVYIGPTLGAPLWWSIQRKIIRICKTQRITSIADFISSRYGKNRMLGGMATLLCVLGSIPYISIQLKAITTSFAVLSGRSLTEASDSFLSSQTLIISLVLALFTILFGTRKLEATERHEGLVTAIAFESIIKLVAFVAVGIFVTFSLFNGPADLFGRAAAVPSLARLFTFGSTTSTANWFWYVCLSMMAILFLPRQFQVAVVENADEKHLNKAMWLFPLYLFLINLFVMPLMFAGKLLLSPIIDADNYVLALPMQFGRSGLALLAYIGGFSAATSMIIVETIALSVMISNNVVMPLLVSRPGWQARFGARAGGPSWSRIVKIIRRLAIVTLLLLAYLYYQYVANHYSLVSVGMISFVAVAQFAPAMIGGLYWKRGSQSGAILGLLAGATIWVYTLVLPLLVSVGMLPGTLITEGPFGFAFLKPYSLFGTTGLDNISHALFWSLFFNVGGYVWGSLNRPQNALDHAQAVLFVDVYRYTHVEQSVTWKGQALVTDLRSLLATFFGNERTRRNLDRFSRRNHLPADSTYADPRLVGYAERWLAGAIGTASARIMVASVANEEPLSVDEVIHILKASQELMTVNKELTRKSAELQEMTHRLSQANERLKKADQQKDDFVSTVTHEIRTPLTSIRALSEILHDQPDMDEKTRQQFLGRVIRETERLSRLINQVLDLERYDSGKYNLTTEPIPVEELVAESVESVAQLARDRGIRLAIWPMPLRIPTIEGNRDLLMQVLINLLSNAIKFAPANTGHVNVCLRIRDNWLDLSITDNGAGIEPSVQPLIFEKFYQASDQTVRKPKGSGLGLAISKRIVELHNGQISVSSVPGQGARFTCSLPVS